MSRASGHGCPPKIPCIALKWWFCAYARVRSFNFRFRSYVAMTILNVLRQLIPPTKAAILGFCAVAFGGGLPWLGTAATIPQIPSGEEAFSTGTRIGREAEHSDATRSAGRFRRLVHSGGVHSTLLAAAAPAVAALVAYLIGFCFRKFSGWGIFRVRLLARKQSSGGDDDYCGSDGDGVEEGAGSGVGATDRESTGEGECPEAGVCEAGAVAYENAVVPYSGHARGAGLVSAGANLLSSLMRALRIGEREATEEDSADEGSLQGGEGAYGEDPNNHGDPTVAYVIEKITAGGHGRDIVKELVPLVRALDYEQSSELLEELFHLIRRGSANAGALTRQAGGFYLREPHRNEMVWEYTEKVTSALLIMHTIIEESRDSSDYSDA